MDTGIEFQSILIGIVGWAATAIAAMSASRLSPIEQRMLVVCSWALWMFFAFGALIARGMLTAEMGLLICGATTAVLGAFAALSSRRPRTRS